MLPVLPPSMGRWIDDENRRVDPMTHYIADIVKYNNKNIAENSTGTPTKKTRTIASLRKAVDRYVQHLRAEHGIDVHATRVNFKPRPLN